MNRLIKKVRYEYGAREFRFLRLLILKYPAGQFARSVHFSG